MSNTLKKNSKRLLSGFLALCLVFSLAFLGFGGIEAEAAMNGTVTTALGDGSANIATSAIDFSNNPNIYGEVDIGEIIALHPSVTYIDLSGTNTTNIVNVPGTVTVVISDTIANGDRTFVVPGTMTFVESAGLDLSVNDLINQVKIKYLDGTTNPIPAGMIAAGGTNTVTLNGVQFSVNPGDVITKADVLLNQAGTYSVAMNFPIAENGGAMAVAVPLQIKKAGYAITTLAGGAANAIVYDGGTVDLYVRKYDENGVQQTLGAVSTYNIAMTSSATPMLQVKSSTLSADGLSIKVVVEASAGVISSSAFLELKDAVTGTMLASKQVVKYANADVTGLTFIEYANTGSGYTVGPTVPSASTVYVKGGTSVSSSNASNLNTFNASTRYLLQGNIGVGTSYIPARYLSQITATVGQTISGVDYDLDCEIIAVDDPTGGATDQVLALVVKAKTVVSNLYPTAPDIAPAVTVTINNASAPATSATLDVQVTGNNALGYGIYQVPSIYANYTKTEIEDAVNNGDTAVRLVAQYEMQSGAWTAVVENGAEIVEESTAYIVALAYYEANGQLFILPDGQINGWYDDQVTPGRLYPDNAAMVIGSTTMTAIAGMSSTLPPPTGFSAGSHILVINSATAYAAPEAEAKVVFAPNGSANNVSFNVKKIEKDVTDYVIVPNGYVLAPGANYYTALQSEIATYDPLIHNIINFPLYKLNVLGEDEIVIGGTNTYGIAEVYSNYRDSITFAASPATSVSGDVTLDNWTSVTQPADVADSVMPVDNNYFDVNAKNTAGAADANAGKTFDITYKNGTVSSKTVTITINNSNITGYYLVLEDMNGNMFSSAPELFNYCNDIDDIATLTTSNFEIPVGTDAKLYAVYAFTNADFYSGGFNNWSDFTNYIVNTANWNITGLPVAYTVVNQGNHYQITGAVPGTGVAVPTAATAAGILAPPVLPATVNTVTLGGTAYDVITAGAAPVQAIVDITAPLVTAIEGYDTTPAVIADAATVSATVGDAINTAPVVDRSAGAAGQVLTALVAGTDYIGTVTMDSATATVAVADTTSPYTINVIGGGTSVISYKYEYTLNGQTVTTTLGGTLATTPTGDYSFTVGSANAEILEVFLVAKNISTGTLAYSGAGVYTAPYSVGTTVEIYPVALNSLALLDPAFLTALDAKVSPAAPATPRQAYIDEAFVAAYPQYFSYLSTTDVDIVQNVTWSTSGETTKGGLTEKSSGGTYFAEVQFYSEIAPLSPIQNYLTVEFDVTTMTLPLSGSSYSGIATSATTTGAAATATTATPAVANFYHLVDAANAYVVDIDTTTVTAGPYVTGSTVQYDVNYYISTQPQANSGYKVSPQGYFFSTLTDVPMVREDPTDHTANVLHIDELSVPASNGYTLAVSGDRLTFVPSVAGTYKFKVYTYNNGNVVAPYYAPGYYTLQFTVTPSTATQTVYYGKTDPLVGLASLTGWASIVETTATPLLDATALSNGSVQMASNTGGVATVNVLDGAGNVMLLVTVTTVDATITAALNQTTTAATPVTLRDGETTLLYWVTTYAPTNAAPSYTLTEEITNWAPDFLTNGGTLGLSGLQVTAVAGTASGMVSYKATHTDGTVQLFWAQIDATTTVSYSYYITDGTNTVTSAAMNVGTPETFNVFDTVTAAPAPINMISSSDTTVAQVTRTGSTFTVTPVANGTATITVYPTAGGSVTLAVTVGAVTPASYTVSGHVEDTLGAAISGASVVITGTGGTFTGTTDSMGNFNIANVVAGSYTAAVSAAGFLPVNVPTFSVAANYSVGNIVMTATAGPTTYVLDGMVVDGAAAPIAGASVVLLDSTSTVIDSATTDTLGQYSFAAVADGNYIITASASGYTSASTSAPVSGANVTAAVITLTASATVYDITGTVVDGATAIVGAVVTVTDGTNTYYATTDATGAFTVYGVPDANYTYTITAPGYTNATGAAVVSGANLALGTITMTPVATSFTVSGTVSNSGGTGIGSATVTITGTTNGYTATVTADSLGNYSFANVPDSDTYNITATASGYNTGTGSAVVSGANVTAAPITLTVKSSGGGGGGGGSTVNYDVKVNSGNGGSASANKSTASAGTKITVTVTPDAGYVIDSVTAKDASGKTVTVTESGAKYQFNMPSSNVTVTVSFKTDGTGTGDHDCPSAPYYDVDISLWYHEYIDYVIEHGVMVGTSSNTFEPNSNVTRGMMVQLFYNIEGKPATSGSNSFNDVAAGDWYYDAVIWASSNGIVTGYDASTYGPNDSVTREQMVTMLYRYTSFKGYDVSASNDLSAFTDANSVSAYAVSAMQWAVGAGMVNGRDATHLVPVDTATRAEVATLITNYCKANSMF